MYLIVALHALLGLIVGSFLNVVILRHNTGRNLSGRSRCLSCNAHLTSWQLIPVLSWVVQMGRCVACGSRISWQYPLVEVATALAFASIAALALPFFEHVLSLLIAAVLVLIAAYDFRHTIIPDEWAYAFGGFALIYAALALPLSAWPLHIAAGPVVAFPLAALWYVSGGRWMGLGDAKLSLGIGWVLGIPHGLIALLAGFLIGAIVSVLVLLPLPYLYRFVRAVTPMRVSQKETETFTMKSEVPFGPFLIAGFALVWAALAFGIGVW